MKRYLAIIAASAALFLASVPPLHAPAATAAGARQEAYRDELDLWLDRLEEHELDFTYPRDYCIIDTNGLRSCGCLQFQENTFLLYASKPYVKPAVFGEGTTNSSIMARYRDCRTQKQVARLMLLHDTGEWRHWRTTVLTKIGLPPAM